MGFGGPDFQKRIAQYSQAEADTYAKAMPKKPPRITWIYNYTVISSLQLASHIS